jgi:hypothetical protein
MFLMLRVFGVVAMLGLAVSSTTNGALAAKSRGGGSYSSPSYEFTVSWDDNVWQGEELTEGEGVELNSDVSYAMIQGFGGYEFGAEGCLEDSATSMASHDYVDGFDTASKKVDRPATAKGAVGELYGYTDLENEIDIALYIECRELPVEQSVLQIILMAYAPDFDAALGDWEELLSQVDSGEKSSSKGKDTKDADKGKSDKSSRTIVENVYTDTEAGFSTEWDNEVWKVKKTKEGDALGLGIEIENDATLGWITGDPLNGDIEDCATTFAEGIGEFEFISKMKPAPKSLDVPETDSDAYGALYTYTDIANDPVKMVAYFECRVAGNSEYSVTVLLATTKESYEDELPLWEDLLGGIQVLDADDAASDDEDVEDEDVDDEEVSDDDISADDEAEDDEPIEEETEVQGVTITGAKFGFELTYDDSVWTVEDLSDVNNDFFDLNSEFAIGTVLAFDMPFDGVNCVNALAELKQGDGVSNFSVAPEEFERPKTARGAVGELFVYTFAGQDGPLDAVTYIECRSVNDGAASLGVMFVTVPAVYVDALPVFETLLAGISTGTEA